MVLFSLWGELLRECFIYHYVAHVNVDLTNIDATNVNLDQYGWKRTM